MRKAAVQFRTRAARTLLPLRRRQRLRRERGGRAMRPRLGAANSTDGTRATAALSRWTHRVGVERLRALRITPTRNAIELSSPAAACSAAVMGELSPWRSNL